MVDKKQAAQDRVARLRNEAKARKLQKQLQQAAEASDVNDSDDNNSAESDAEDFFKAKKTQDSRKNSNVE